MSTLLNSMRREHDLNGSGIDESAAIAAETRFEDACRVAEDRLARARSDHQAAIAEGGLPVQEAVASLSWSLCSGSLRLRAHRSRRDEKFSRERENPERAPSL